MEESIVSYFEQWADEFGRAVEMFTGEKPSTLQKPADPAQVDDSESKRDQLHWWQQETEDPQRFRVWVGAEEECWAALGDQGEGSDPKDLFQEMVSQANQGAAAVLSSSFPNPLRFGAVSNDAPPSLPLLRVSRVNVTFKGKSLPPLIVAMETAAAKILDGPEPMTAEPAKSAASAVQRAAALPANASMVERLMDLQLPVSVLLGQTIMPIRDALKIASGSLIELDRQLGDYVEVVVHGTVVARGEIVAVRGNYGVRIKEVISRKDRIALKDAA